jgi:hypothetical protein
MTRRTIAQDLITEFVPTMDYVSRPTSKWRGLYIISTKIGINTWKYLKSENGLKICHSDPNYDCTSGFMVRNGAKNDCQIIKFCHCHLQAPLGISCMEWVQPPPRDLNLYLNKILLGGYYK